MKVKDRYWEAENSIRFANPEKTTRPLLCGPKVSEGRRAYPPVGCGKPCRGNGGRRRDRPTVSS